MIEKENVEVEYCPTEEMIADFMRKLFQWKKSLGIWLWDIEIRPVKCVDRSVLDVYIHKKIINMGDPLYTWYILYKRI